MITRMDLRRSLAALLGATLIATTSVSLAFNMGNMMNPSKWMGGDRDRGGYGDEGGWDGPGYGGPGGGYGGPGYGGYGGPGYRIWCTGRLRRARWLWRSRVRIRWSGVLWGSWVWVRGSG